MGDKQPGSLGEGSVPSFRTRVRIGCCLMGLLRSTALVITVIFLPERLGKLIFVDNVGLFTNYCCV